MIVYRKRWCGLLDLHIYGSPFPRTMIYAMAAAGVGAALEATGVDLYSLHSSNSQDGFVHPYPYQMYAFIVGFGLIFRTNLAYSRYWEGRDAIANMGSKWADAVLQFDSFLLEPGKNDDGEDAEELSSIKAQFLHAMSLTHALAIMTIRGDDVGLPTSRSIDHIVEDSIGINQGYAGGEASDVETAASSATFTSSPRNKKYYSQHCNDPRNEEPPLDPTFNLPREEKLCGVFCPRFSHSFNMKIA